MRSQQIPHSRIQFLNGLNPGKGDFVLYWMQQSQRAEYNHALEYAIQQANKIDQPVLVVFALMDDYPELTFTHSQPATYENIRQQAPELFARVVEFRTSSWK